MIKEKLPNITSPVLSVASSTSVIVTIAVPQKAKTDSVEYSRLTLIYSSDPSMQDNHKVLIDLDDHQSISRKATISEKEFTAEKENNEKTISRKVKVTNLESGKFYFFQLVAGFQDVEGTPTELESIFVDGLPEPPAKPIANINFDNSSITIFSELGSTTGSAIQSYRLYHSADYKMKTNFLVDEVSVKDLQLEEGRIKFVFTNPELRLSHFFHITTVNGMGESAPSEVSEKCIIGIFLMIYSRLSSKSTKQAHY